MIACAGLPSLALVTWTRAADHAKSRSIQGRFITSTALKQWNFGTLEQRLSGATWNVFAIRAEQPLGRHVPFVVAALGLIMARRRIAEVIGCLLLYLVGVLTFTNLYFVHDYYFFANNIFLIVAAGMAIAAMLERGRPLSDGAIAGLVLLLGSMAFDYSWMYRPIQARNETDRQRMGAAIHRRTAPDDVVVLLGFEWSSEVPYYSGRRTLCLPTWSNPAQVRRCLKTLKPYHIGAVAILPPVQKPITREALLALLLEQGFVPEPSPVNAPGELLLRADRPRANARAARDGASADARSNAPLLVNDGR